MTPFHEIKTVPPVKAIGMRGDLSLWAIDTAFGRLYDKAMEGRLMFREPAIGVRHGEVRVPDAFRSEYHVLFPLNDNPGRGDPGRRDRRPARRGGRLLRPPGPLRVDPVHL